MSKFARRGTEDIPDAAIMQRKTAAVAGSTASQQSDGVDATASRLMRIDPQKIKYLAEAGEFLGNLAENRIEQIGEPIERVQQDFRVIDDFKNLKLAAA